MRTVVARMLAGRFRACSGFHRPDNLFDLRPRDHAGADDPRDGSSQGDDRAFDADSAGSAIKNHVDTRAQTLAYMFRGGRRDFCKPVGAGRGDWDLRGFEQSLGQRVRGNSQTDARKPGGDQIGHAWLFGNDDSQRSWPEPAGEEFRSLGPYEREFTGHPDAGYVHDQGAGERAALGFENPANGRFIESVCTKAINGFGRKSDETPGPKKRSGFFYLGAHSGKSAPSPAVLPVLRQTR